MESNMESCKVSGLRLAKTPQICCVTLGKCAPFSGLQCLHFIIRRLDQVNSKAPPLAIILPLHTSSLLGHEPPGIKCSGHCLSDQWGSGGQASRGSISGRSSNVHVPFRNTCHPSPPGSLFRP